MQQTGGAHVAAGILAFVVGACGGSVGDVSRGRTVDHPADAGTPTNGDVDAPTNGDADADATSASDTAPPLLPRNPRCPEVTPRDGDPCDGLSPFGCEYGGDQFGRCTTYAACAPDSGGTRRFRVQTPSACRPQNPPQCPPTSSPFHQTGSPVGGKTVCDLLGVDAGSDVPLVSCFYATEMCAWVYSSLNGCGFDCVSYSDFAQWTPPCPWPRPLIGDACGVSAHECVYHEVPCAYASAGPPMICQNGYWERDTRPMCIP